MASLLKFTVGTLGGRSGEALIVEAGSSVQISNDSDLGVQSWRVELVGVPSASQPSRYVAPPGSPLLIAESASVAPVSASFVPDVPGCYRIRLTTWASTGFSGASDIDIRNIAVLDDRGNVIPPYQDDPLPLPSKPDELNFNGQLFGWAGSTVVPMNSLAVSSRETSRRSPPAAVGSRGAYSRLARWLLVSPWGMTTDDQGNLWISQIDQGGVGSTGVVCLNTRTGEWEDFVAMIVQDGRTSQFSTLVHAKGHLWVVDNNSVEPTLWRYNTSTREDPTRVSVAFGGMAGQLDIAYGRDHLFVPVNGTLSSTNVIARFDINDLANPVQVDSQPISTSSLSGVAYDVANDRVWVTVSDGSSFQRVWYISNASGGSFGSATPTPVTLSGSSISGGWDIIVAAGYVWAAMADSGSIYIYKIDPVTGLEVLRINAGFSQSTWIDLAYDPQNDWIVITPAYAGSNALRRIDVRTNTLLGSPLTLPNIPFRAHWNNGYIYAVYSTGTGTSALYKVNPRSWTLEHTYEGDTTVIQTYKRERTVFITDSTSDDYVLPDDTGLVIITVTAGHPKRLHLPPELSTPQSQNPAVTRIRADGATIRVIDTTGVIGDSDSSVMIFGYQGDGIYTGDRMRVGEIPYIHHALKPFSSITFRFTYGVNPSSGAWLVESDSQPFATRKLSDGDTIPMGKNLVYSEGPATLRLPDPAAFGFQFGSGYNYLDQLWGTEFVVRATMGEIKLEGGPSLIDNRYEYIVPNGGWVRVVYIGSTSPVASTFTVVDTSSPRRVKRTGRKRPYRITTPRNWVHDGDGNLWFTSLGGTRDIDVPGFWRINEAGDGIDEVVTLRGQRAYSGWVEVSSGENRQLNGLAYQNGFLWAVDYNADELVGFNPKTYEVVSGGSVGATNPRKLVAGRNNFLYLAEDSSNVVTRYDVSDPSSITQVDSATLADTPWAVEYDPAHDRVWISMGVGLQYMDASTMALSSFISLAAQGLANANNLIYAPQVNGSDRDFIYLLGRRSDNNVGYWLVRAGSGSVVNWNTLNVPYLTNPEWIDLAYDSLTSQLWVSTGTNLQVFGIFGASLATFTPANPPHRVFLHQGHLWTSWFGGTGAENAEVSRYNRFVPGSPELTLTETDIFEIDEPTRSCIIDSDTPSEVILSDEVDHVFIDLSSSFIGTRQIYLPPLRSEATTDNGDPGAYDLLDGYEVTFVDVNGTLGKSNATVTVTAQDDELIWHADNFPLGPQNFYELRDAYGTVTFKWERNQAGSSIGRWVVKNADRNWVNDTTLATVSFTARKGRVRHLTGTTAGGGNTITLGTGSSGDEIVIKDRTGSFSTNFLYISGTVDGGLAPTLTSNYQSLHLVHNGSGWSKVGETGDGLIRVGIPDKVPNYLGNKLKNTAGLTWLTDAVGSELVIFGINSADAMPLYLWDSSTSGAPLSGRMGANITSPPDSMNAITEFRIHVNSRNGTMSLWNLYRRLCIGDLIKTQISSNGVVANSGGIFRITSLAVPNTLPNPTYVTIQVTPLVTTSTPYNNGNPVALAFYNVGDRDDQITADVLTVDPTPDYTPVESGGSSFWDTARIISISNGSLGTPTISGLTAVTAGARIKKLTNRGTSGIILTHNDAGSLSANRFQIPGGGSLTLQPNDVVDVTYDTNISKWRVG